MGNSARTASQSMALALRDRTCPAASFRNSSVIMLMQDGAGAAGASQSRIWSMRFQVQPSDHSTTPGKATSASSSESACCLTAE
jgi:hypothetical protein